MENHSVPAKYTKHGFLISKKIQILCKVFIAQTKWKRAICLTVGKHRHCQEGIVTNKTTDVLKLYKQVLLVSRKTVSLIN